MQRGVREDAELCTCLHKRIHKFLGSMPACRCDMPTQSLIMRQVVSSTRLVHRSTILMASVEKFDQNTLYLGATHHCDFTSKVTNQ